MSATVVDSPERPRLTVPGRIVLLLGGVMLGLFGGFLQAVTIRVGGFPIPVGATLCLLTLVACLRAVIHLYERREPAVYLLVGWIVTSIALALPLPGGDIVIAGSPIAFIYLLAGAIIGTAVTQVPARLVPVREIEAGQPR